MTRKTIITAVTTLAITAALTACTTTPAAPVTDKAPVGTNRPSATEPTTEAPAPVESTPASDGTAKFGSTYKWENGLSITVSAPKAYKPGEYAAGADQFKNNVILTVTLVNNTGKPYDPNMVFMTMQSGNEEASQVFDSGNGISGAPSTKVLNKREAKFKVAFNVANPKDLVLEVTPGFDYDSVIFTN